jgi:hypothetical protein
VIKLHPAVRQHALAATCDNLSRSVKEWYPGADPCPICPLALSPSSFTDIEGGPKRWERDRAAMAAAVEHHFALLDAAIQAHGGAHFTTVGDAV